MSQLSERIAQFRKMATDDPENELGHYRLGQLLQEAEQYPEAVQAFERTLELSPQFSRVYVLLATCYLKMNNRAEAVATLKKGYAVAEERGDNVPRDEMGRMLGELKEAVPVTLRTTPAATGVGAGGGFRCQRPGCMWGARARPLAGPPMNDEIGKRIHETICAECWTEWLRNFSIKVINELRLDLSTEHGQEEYDRYMREFFGIEQFPPMDIQEYLVRYGSAGEFGRFRPVTPVSCGRGDRVVVRSHRGLELGELLCPATPGHAHYLPNTSVGQLLRPAGPDDERQAERTRELGQALFADARRLTAELNLPLEVVDVEVVLDGEQAIVHHLPWGAFDERDLVSALVRQHGLRVRLYSLRTADEPEEEEHGCGRPDCGSKEGGGCSTCGSGGCSTCGTAKPEEVRAHFAALRERMDEQGKRVPLL